MVRLVTSKQALKAIQRVRLANERGFSRYQTYLSARDVGRKDTAADRVHYWLDREEAQLAILEAFIRQQETETP